MSKYLLKSVNKITFFFSLIVLFIISNAHSAEPHVLAFDVETSGSSFTKHGIVGIGATLMDARLTELASFQVSVSLPKGRVYEQSCMEDFWSKHSEAYAFVNKDPLPPQEAMRLFCEFLARVDVETKGTEVVVSNNPSFDIAWLNVYLSEFTDRKPLNYSSTGKFRMIWDSGSIQKFWASCVTGAFPAPANHREVLGLRSLWPQLHLPLHDARTIAKFYIDIMTEVKQCIAATPLKRKAAPENLENEGKKPGSGDAALRYEKKGDAVTGAGTKKKIEVVPYNAEWPKQFEAERKAIEEVLGDACAQIFHVGSTSVPGLSAKPLIDMIAVVANVRAVEGKLFSIGFKFNGEYNIPFRLVYGKKAPVAVHLHVYEDKDNPEIQLNLMFRDFLRQSAVARAEYDRLKAGLVDNPTSHEIVSGGLSGYTLGKDEFIKRLLAQAGFNGLCPRLCTHYAEWDVYNRIGDGKSKKVGVPFKPMDEKSVAENNFHFVLYEGPKIIAATHLELLSSGEIALRFLGSEESARSRDHDLHLMVFVEKWMRRKGHRVIKTHAVSSDIDLLRSQGFVEMPFKESGPAFDGAGVVNLGKLLT